MSELTFEGELQLRARVRELEARLAGADQARAAAERERDAARAALTEAAGKIGALDEQLTIAKGEAEIAEQDSDELREQLEVADKQMRVVGAALRGSEEGREAATAIAAVLRDQLEQYAGGRVPWEPEKTDEVLKNTAGLAETFVQSVRDRWEVKLAEALNGNPEPGQAMSKVFADALAKYDARRLGLVAEWFDRQSQPWAAEAAALVRQIRRTHELRSGLEVTS